jgi:hypothetical protein
MFYPTAISKIIDPNFNLENTLNCELRLMIAERSLTIVVYDQLTAAFPFVEKYNLIISNERLKANEVLARILQSHALTRSNFSKIEVFLNNNYKTLIPSAFFDAEKTSEILHFNFKLDNTFIVQDDFVKSIDSHLIYGYEENLNTILKSVFSQFTIKHYATFLLQHVITHNKLASGVYAYVQDYSFDVILIKDFKLHFYNTFNFQNTDEFLYFVLAVYNQNELNRELIPLRLFGEIEKGSSIFNAIYEFVRDVDIFSTEFDKEIKYLLAESIN